MESTQMAQVQDLEIGAQEAAKILKRDVQTIQRFCREKRLDARQIGGKGPWLIRLSSVVASRAPSDPPPSTTPEPPKEPAG